MDNHCYGFCLYDWLDITGNLKMPQHLQRERKHNQDLIAKWIQEGNGIENIDRNELERKAVLVIGCTRSKAREYIKEITGEE